MSAGMFVKILNHPGRVEVEVEALSGLSHIKSLRTLSLSVSLSVVF